MVAAAVNEGELDDIEALGLLSTLIAAGGESRTSLAGTAVRILAEQEGLQAQLRETPSLIPVFIEEALRVESPFKGPYRVVTRDTKLGSTSLQEASRLILVWPAARKLSRPMRQVSIKRSV
jgi:cytochrome P450